MTHTIDLAVRGEQSGPRTECKSTGILDIGNDATNPNRIYWIPIESDGVTVFDTYTVNMDITPTDPDRDEYRYVFAIYRQTGKLSDTTTTNGVGELVANTTLVGPTWTGNHGLRDSAALAAPVTLLQGSYFISLTFESVSGEALSGPLTVIGNDMINAFTSGNTWVRHSHLQGTLTVPGVLPDRMTTNDANLAGMDNTFTWYDSFWAGIFDSRDVSL